MISIKNLDPKKVKIDKNSYKNVLTYYIRCKTTNSVKSFYLIINKLIRYIEESNENKYLTLVPTNKSKDILKKYDELLSKIRDLIG